MEIPITLPEIYLLALVHDRCAVVPLKLMYIWALSCGNSQAWVEWTFPSEWICFSRPPRSSESFPSGSSVIVFFLLHSLECPGLQEVWVPRDQTTETRNHKKLHLPCEHLLISSEPKPWFNWRLENRRQDSGPTNPWEWAGEQQRKPTQSFHSLTPWTWAKPPATKERPQEMHLSQPGTAWGNVSRPTVSRVWG